MAPPIDDRNEAGLGMLEQRGWGFKEGVRELDQNLWRIITETNFGAIRSRPSLSARERELICIAIPDRDRRPRVALQFKNARHVGITREDLKEVVPQKPPYATLPRALRAMASLKPIQAGAVPELQAPLWSEVGR